MPFMECTNIVNAVKELNHAYQEPTCLRYVGTESAQKRGRVELHSIQEAKELPTR